MVACNGLQLAEVTVYIVAQTMPLLRVLVLGQDSKTSSNLGTRSDLSSKPTRAVQLGSQSHDTEIELVELPTGKIVAALSEEGKAFRSAEASKQRVRAEDISITPPAADDGNLEYDAGLRHSQEIGQVTGDDEVHKLWEAMGLSRQAWSVSPEIVTSRGPGTTGHRHQVSDLNLSE